MQLYKVEEDCAFDVTEDSLHLLFSSYIIMNALQHTLPERRRSLITKISAFDAARSLVLVLTRRQ
jgi:hypothetical protein